ncbi:hypothetical protein ACWD3Z_36760 [Streptomyces sp. NPDC002740]
MGQEHARGVATTPLTKVGTATGSGTTIAFWPDADIFGATDFSFDGLEERFRELAFLNQGLEVSLTDLRRSDEPRSVRLRFPDGTGDFVDFLDGHTAASAPMDTIAFEQENPRMAGETEVAFRWCSCPDERVQSFANSRPTVAGTHAVGFRDGVAAAVTAYAREQGLLTPMDLDFGADRIGVGLTAVVSVKLDRPKFEGATRGVLGNSELRDCVGQAVQDHLGKTRSGPQPSSTRSSRVPAGTDQQRTALLVQKEGPAGRRQNADAQSEFRTAIQLRVRTWGPLSQMFRRVDGR